VPPLTEAEVQVGLVAYLDEQPLRNHPDVRWFNGRGSYHGPPAVRPFVCSAVDAGSCQWTPLTREESTGSGYGRARILPAWKSGGTSACHGNEWLAEDSYLVDGANIYEGPVEPFVLASHAECTSPATRARVNADGTRRIEAEVAKQVARREEAR